MADTFTVLGRIVLTREPGYGPDREPRCRVEIGFDVAFHKVKRVVLYTAPWVPGRVATFPVSDPQAFLFGVICRQSEIAMKHVSANVPEPRYSCTFNIHSHSAATPFLCLPKHRLMGVWSSLLKSTMLRGAIRAGAQEETR